ncbi:hypothetical protein ANO11243_020310 [Dothideomycetidae sp. 11243]|nr:hypothetical protein ANO11243_020310 [fungal sp. No.11243]
MGKQFVRTCINSQNPHMWDDGRAGIEYFKPGGAYFGRQIAQHDNAWTDGSASFMAPPAHFHILQSETFEVESGSGIWFAGGKKTQLHKGDTILVPACIGHRFEAVPNSKGEPLVILWRYDVERHQMEERFFRNVFSYFLDCKKAGVQPDPFQLAVFCAAAHMPVDVVPCPGGEYVRCVVNTLLMWFMAAIGWLFLGYKISYEEYYDPEVSRKVWTDGV